MPGHRRFISDGREDGLEFRVLGPLTVVNDDGRVPLGGMKQRSALAILVLGAGHVVSRQQLIDGIWGESPPPSAGPGLDTYISRLRRVLPADGTALVTQAPGYRLELPPGVLDLEQFETQVATARKALADGDVQVAADAFDQALALFRGEPLEDLAQAPFADMEIRRLEELRLGVLEQRLDANLALGRDADVIGEVETLVAARYPLREGLWSRLMLALYRSGRQGDALHAFDRARQVLSEELGLDPGESLLRMHRRILQQDPSLMEGVATDGAVREIPASRAPSDAPPGEARLTDPKSPGRPASSRRIPAMTGRRRLLLAAAAVVAVVLAPASVIVPGLTDKEAAVSAPTRPRTAVIDAQTGEEVGSVPIAELAVSAYPVYGDGTFWVQNFSPNSFVEIDPDSGAVIGQLTYPFASPTGSSEESATLTPFDVDGDSLWVGSGHDLVRLDMSLDRVIERFHLDQYVGGGASIVEGVAIGDGSVWVSRDVGGGQIVRLDPSSGRVQHRFDAVTAHLQFAFADGSLWAADDDGLIRIDAATTPSSECGESREPTGSPPVPGSAGPAIRPRAWSSRSMSRVVSSRPTRPVSVPASWDSPTVGCGSQTATRALSRESMPSPALGPCSDSTTRRRPWPPAVEACWCTSSRVRPCPPSRTLCQYRRPCSLPPCISSARGMSRR